MEQNSQGKREEWEWAMSMPSNAIVVTDVTSHGHGRDVVVSDGTGNWVH